MAKVMKGCHRNRGAIASVP